jgi:glycosyltransferase involved in cell wall biosynthesis
LRIVVVTDFPSPYQVEYFEAINKSGCQVDVVYIRNWAPERAWKCPTLLHNHRFLFDKTNADISAWIVDSDLVVFSGYQSKSVRHLISCRNRIGKAWAFWGERLGFKLPRAVGHLYRYWALRELRRSRASIWGIGKWAIDSYRWELGGDRTYFNIPYCRDLARFFAIGRRYQVGRPCRFLFSGSFTRRKGFDLILSAFSKLVREGHHIELHILGQGPLESTLQLALNSFPTQIVMHGFKQWDELATVYASADIVCVPSRYDGWGLVVVEGLAAGMPIISTNKTGAALELVDPRNGWVIPAGDEHALLSTMRVAANLEVNRREVMSKYARQIAMTHNIEIGVERFVNAAESTIAAWPATVRTN